MASALQWKCSSVELLVFCWQEESDLKRGAGGRIIELEAPEVMADEFAPVGMKRAKAATAAREEVFKRYDPAVREKVKKIYVCLVVWGRV